MKIYLEQLGPADIVTLVGDRGASVRIVKTHGDEPATATVSVPAAAGIKAVKEAGELCDTAVMYMDFASAGYTWFVDWVKGAAVYVEGPPVSPALPPDPDLGAALERERELQERLEKAEKKVRLLNKKIEKWC